MICIDQTGRKIELKSTPTRIISLVPSQTELLFDLGLEEEVVGITKFCIHPDDWFHNKKRVGGTKDVDMDAIAKLEPDLIIANKEENDREQMEELCRRYPVWISDITTLDEAYHMIHSIGRITGREVNARKIRAEIAFRFENFRKHFPHAEKIRTAYLIWNKPYMAAGRHTFIDHLMDICGLENVFADGNSRYPEITLAELREKDPALLLLSSEPYPFGQKHADELKEVLPSATIQLVDGEIFSWYGSRLLHSPAYFEKFVRKINTDN